VCIIDAGNNGVMILADRMLPPRRAGLMIPGPQSHAAKPAFEKYLPVEDAARPGPAALSRR
jgi:sulfide:quinone oxidoreductase